MRLRSERALTVPGDSQGHPRRRAGGSPRIRRGHPSGGALERSAGLPGRSVHLRHQPSRQRHPRRGRQGRRRAPIPVRLVVQPLRRRRRQDARRARRLQSDYRLRIVEGAGRSRTSRSSRTTRSARRSCATRPPTARRRGCAPTSSSTTSSGVAYTTGEVLIQSDGTPWRPLVHVQDISRAFLAVLEAPREAIHNQSFNVGSSQENYQIRDDRRHRAARSCPAAR